MYQFKDDASDELLADLDVKVGARVGHWWWVENRLRWGTEVEFAPDPTVRAFLLRATATEILPFSNNPHCTTPRSRNIPQESRRTPCLDYHGLNTSATLWGPIAF